MHQDLIATFCNQFAKIIMGPMMMFLIPYYLNVLEQGYWYTFISLAALIVFADLGFSNIVLQFSAHEFAYLSFHEKGVVVGKPENIERIASFFKFTLKWFFVASLVSIPVICIIGYYILDSGDNLIAWKIPWILYSLVSILVFFNSVMLSFFEGCDSVKITQYIRMKSCIVNCVCTLVSLSLGLSLYSLFIASLVSTTFSILSMLFQFNCFIKTMLSLDITTQNEWRKQFLPLIIRYAISWCSGYFLFQLFTPIAFKYYGPEMAGKVGLCLSLWTAGSNISLSWITSITPKINMLISEKKWEILDELYEKYFKRSMVTYILGFWGYFLMYYVFLEKSLYGSRILDFWPMFTLGVCFFMQLIVAAFAVYLRAHKKEPMVVVSVISAMYVSISTFMCALFLDSNYYFIGYLTSFVITLPITLRIFKNQKKMHMEKIAT